MNTDTDAEAEAKRQADIAAFFMALPAKRFPELATVRRRGRDYKVSIRHEVGFGGSLNFTVFNVASKESAVDFVRKQLKARRTPLAVSGQGEYTQEIRP